MKKIQHVLNLEKIKDAPDYQKAYYIKNEDKIKEYKRKYKKEYYLKNKDKLNKSQKEFQKEYYLKNKDKLNESQKEFQKDYYLKNIDKIGENRKDYGNENKLTIRENKIKKKIERNPSYIPRSNYSWKSREESRKYFESIAPLLHISDFSDWYRISGDQIKQFGGSTKHNGLRAIQSSILMLYRQ
jgi:hypothetical protein